MVERVQVGGLMTHIDALVQEIEQYIAEVKAEEAKWQGVEGDVARKEREHLLGKRLGLNKAHTAAICAQLKERIYGYAGVA